MGQAQDERVKEVHALGSQVKVEDLIRGMITNRATTRARLAEASLAALTLASSR